MEFTHLVDQCCVLGRNFGGDGGGCGDDEATARMEWNECGDDGAEMMMVVMEDEWMRW